MVLRFREGGLLLLCSLDYRERPLLEPMDVLSFSPKCLSVAATQCFPFYEYGRSSVIRKLIGAATQVFLIVGVVVHNLVSLIDFLPHFFLPSHLPPLHPP